MNQLFGLQHRRDIPPTKAFPRGKDATAPPRRSLHQGTPGRHSPGVACLNGALPHKKIPPHEFCRGIILWFHFVEHRNFVIEAAHYFV